MQTWRGTPSCKYARLHAGFLLVRYVSLSSVLCRLEEVVIDINFEGLVAMEFIDCTFLYSTSKGRLLPNEVDDVGELYLYASLQADSGNELEFSLHF